MAPRKPHIGLLATLLLAGTAVASPFGYVVNSDGSDPGAPTDHLYRVNLSTGSHELIGPMGYFDVEGLAFGPEGVLYGVDDASNTLLHVNTASGSSQRAFAVASSRGNLALGLGNLDPGLAFDCSGQLYMSSDSTRSLYRLDLERGSALIVGGPGALGAQISGLAANDQALYGIGVTGDYSLYRINTETGAATAVGPLGIDVAFNDAGLDFDENGQLWAIIDLSDATTGSRASRIYRIDVNTGAASFVANTLVGIEGLAIAPTAACRGTVGNPVPVPGPGPLGLVLLGGLLLLGAGFSLLPRRH